MSKHRMTRRRFLAASAAGGAAAVGASYLTFDAWGKAKKPKNEEITVTPTLCDACGNWCAMNVYTRGGRIWKAEGLPIAGNNVGRICAKGHAMLHDVYNKDRIRSPLKRIGPNKFQPISWEQAYKDIGQKLHSIMEKNG
ncbi:MAG: molybdopterin-dependent oxidoreductase, partial [Thermodesulfobacteriota bacterium]